MNLRSASEPSDGDTISKALRESRSQHTGFKDIDRIAELASEPQDDVAAVVANGVWILEKAKAVRDTADGSQRPTSQVRDGHNEPLIGYGEPDSSELG